MYPSRAECKLVFGGILAAEAADTASGSSDRLPVRDGTGVLLGVGIIALFLPPELCFRVEL